nr:protein ALP1-like [Leptinotarsa decemlineata]
MRSTREEMENDAQKFYRISRFPRVIDAIDCTLVRIDYVGGSVAEIFRSRKNFLALNVQTVSDANLRIKNIVARWPGSAHDETIFKNSILKNEFERDEYEPYILIRDSGYHLEPYLTTKLRRVMMNAENLYNESIIRTRNVVERQYGVWKKQFPVLSVGMRLKLNTIIAVIIATAVLHNMAIDWSDEPLPE